MKTSSCPATRNDKAFSGIYQHPVKLQNQNKISYFVSDYMGRMCCRFHTYH